MGGLGMGFRMIRKGVFRLAFPKSVNWTASQSTAMHNKVPYTYPVKHIFLLAAIRKRPLIFAYGEMWLMKIS